MHFPEQPIFSLMIHFIVSEINYNNFNSQFFRENCNARLFYFVNSTKKHFRDLMDHGGGMKKKNYLSGEGMYMFSIQR